MQFMKAAVEFWVWSLVEYPQRIDDSVSTRSLTRYAVLSCCCMWRSWRCRRQVDAVVETLQSVIDASMMSPSVACSIHYITRSAVLIHFCTDRQTDRQTHVTPTDAAEHNTWRSRCV